MKGFHHFQWMLQYFASPKWLKCIIKSTLFIGQYRGTSAFLQHYCHFMMLNHCIHLGNVHLCNNWGTYNSSQGDSLNINFTFVGLLGLVKNQNEEKKIALYASTCNVLVGFLKECLVPLKTWMKGETIVKLQSE